MPTVNDSGVARDRTVVLVHPCVTARWSVQPWCDLPLELIAVGSPLARKGYRVRIIDQRVDPNWREALVGELARNPVCVGVTSTTGPQLRHALDVSQIVKAHGDVPVVWGGVHATLLPEQTLERPEIDFVVQGEGERSFDELVAALERGGPVGDIAGVWAKRGGRIVHGAPRPFIDLNAEPPLAYDLVDVARYTRTVFGVKRLSFSTSRGCSYPCAFCYSTIVHKRHFRALSPDVALAHIKDFTGRYGVRGLFPTDANFFLDLDRARAILEGVVREQLGLVFTRLHIRFDTLRRLTGEDLTLFERAGVKCLALGVESGSERIRTLLRKPIDEGELHAVNARFRSSPIMPMYFFMLGFPTETTPELRATVDLFMRLASDNPRAYVSVNTYAPFPGTELFDLAVSEGLTPPARMEDWFSFSYRNLGANGAWLSAPMRKAVAMLDFCSFFASDRGYVTPFKQTHRLATAAARVYAPVARFRMRHMIHQAPIEIAAARKLGLYGHAD
jgi:anaerobic magnesium-protoporphyrin IX monomethyl ester cyclase